MRFEYPIRYTVLVPLISLLLLSLGAGPVKAEMRIVLHAAPVMGGCQVVQSLGCDFLSGSDAVTRAELDTDYHVYVVLVDVDPERGILGIEFGIYYDFGAYSGLDIQSWTACSSTSTTGENWPQPGSGVDLAFFSCRGTTADPADPQGESLVVLGYFTVSAPSLNGLYVVPRLDKGATTIPVTDCAFADRTVSYLATGVIGFGTAGEDPCQFGQERFPVGCCLEGGCTSTDVFNCEYLGGTVIFDFEHPFGCTSAGDCMAPALSTTWGRIKATYD